MNNDSIKFSPTQPGFDEFQAILYLSDGNVNKSETDITRILAIDDSYFGVPEYRDIFNFIKTAYRENHELPDYFELKNRYDAVLPDEPILRTVSSEHILKQIQLNKKYLLFTKLLPLLKSSTVDTIDLDIESASSILSSAADIGTHSSESWYKKNISTLDDRIRDMVNAPKIPTGFPEIDSIMRGGLSTFEELFLVVARINVGKSWVCSRIASAAMKSHHRVLYYSPEMQSTVIELRYATWMGNGKFKNSDVINAKFNDAYEQMLKDLDADNHTDNPEYGDILTVEDKDFDNGVTVLGIEAKVVKNNIDLVIIDGLSYMKDINHSRSEYEGYRNICNDLLRLSKQHHCAVVVSAQANRETKNNTKDDDSQGFPSLYEIAGSDHPGRIALNVVAFRKDYDKATHTQTMGLKLLKMRNARFDPNQVISYSWDPDQGIATLSSGTPDYSSRSTTVVNVPTPDMPLSDESFGFSSSDDDSDDLLDDSDDITF